MKKTPASRLAQVKVKYAVDNGKLTKPSACERCGREGLELHGHHEDYSKPLEVEWLCTRCHGRTRSSEHQGSYLPPEIAPEVPCHPDYIRKINKGQRFPRPEMFTKIKMAMQRRGVDLSYDDLLTINEPPNPSEATDQAPAPETPP